MNDDGPRDDEVLALRTTGKSFAAIARQLGLERAREANAAFNRALRRKPEGERTALRGAEERRLDTLAEGIRDDETLGPDDAARRLRTVEQLRSRLLAD